MRHLSLFFLCAATAVLSAAGLTAIGAINAVRRLRAEADKGDLNAALQLAMCHASGYGVRYDPAEARRRVAVLAAQGHARSQATLANFCRTGFGGPLDLAEARKWLAAAAEQGNANARTMLAMLLLHGAVNLPPNPAEALRLFQDAAQTDPFAQAMQGFCLHFGLGTAPSLPEAFQCFQQAAKRGSDYAMFQLGLFHLNGLATPRDFHQAFQAFQDGARAGNRNCIFEVGCCHLTGHGTTPDRAAAMTAFRQVAALDSPQAQLTLAICLLREGQTDEARRWLDKAAPANNYASALRQHLSLLTPRETAALPARAQRKDARAQYLLALACDFGIGQATDHPAAIEWLHQAAQNGSSDAMLLLWYYSQMGIIPGFETAIQRYLLPAAELGNSIAQTSLATEMLFRGQRDQALAWLRKAAAQKDPVARVSRATLAIYGLDTGLERADLVRELEELAAAGDPVALYRLAQVFDNGIGTAPDAGRSIQCLQRAAAIDADAAIALAQRLIYGYGGATRDLDAAEKLLAPLAKDSPKASQLCEGIRWIRLNSPL